MWWSIQPMPLMRLVAKLVIKTRWSAFHKFVGLGAKHQYAIICADLSDIATYAKVDNAMYRLLKNNTPAVTTFILPATSEVPRRLMHPNKKTIGLRIPSNTICRMLLKELGEPLLTSTLILPGHEDPLDDPYEIDLQLNKRIDVLIDGGLGTLSTTSIVDLCGDHAENCASWRWEM